MWGIGVVLALAKLFSFFLAIPSLALNFDTLIYFA
jgi:hypothetical protein